MHCADSSSASRPTTAESKENGKGMTLEDADLPPAELRSSTCPQLFQRLRHNKSILALAISDDNIFAGTQGGEIIVRRIPVVITESLSLP